MNMEKTMVSYILGHYWLWGKVIWEEEQRRERGNKGKGAEGGNKFFSAHFI